MDFCYEARQEWRDEGTLPCKEWLWLPMFILVSRLL